MTPIFISLQDASEISGRSIQTIRRAIKAKRILARRQKTPQGFNYMVDKESLIDAFQLEGKVMQDAVEITQTQEFTEQINLEATQALKSIESQYKEMKDLLGAFNRTMQVMTEHNNQERDNFYRLMKTFQDRVQMLEENIRVLNEKANKKWYQIWSK
jgi:hypothetical protein